jgi:hypothetical protein
MYIYLNIKFNTLFVTFFYSNGKRTHRDLNSLAGYVHSDHTLKMKAARTIGGAVTSLEDVVEEVEENEDDD